MAVIGSILFVVWMYGLMVIIGLELLESIKAYLESHVIHVEVVLLVALVAVARKIILLDYKDISHSMLFAVAALVIALSVGYFVIRRAMTTIRQKDAHERNE